jgi:serine/threonine-protein kinase
MAAIADEHLVPVYEVNEHVGLPFFVMEYVPGGSLERRVRAAGAFDAISVIRIGLQVAQALAAAHKQGLVHRDIKPGNILLDRGTERVRVVDFGLVRVSNDVSCTRSGVITGTPQYMAPEQVRGEICDGQSDLFSLGAVMYALCTGHPPFRADTLYGVMQRIVHDEPRSIRENNPLVPEWLEQIIGRLLSKERRGRFATADEVIVVLQEHLAHLQHPEAGRASFRNLPWRRRSFAPGVWRRKSVVAWAGVGIIGLALAVYSWPGAGSQPRTGEKETDPSAVAPSVSPPDLPPIAPHWDVDGTIELRAATEEFESQGRAATPANTRDPWSDQMQLLDESLAKLSFDLESLRKSGSSSTNP